MRKFKKIAYLLIFLVLIVSNGDRRMPCEAFMGSTMGSKVSKATSERRWNTLSLDDDQRQLQQQQQQQQHVAVHSQHLSASSTSSMLHVAKKQKPALSWDERFIELRQHKHKFNHTSVSKRLPEYVELGKWTSRQRQRYKHLALELEQCHRSSGESVDDADSDSITNTSVDVASDVDEVALSRIRRLNSIGFQWDASHMKHQKERQQWFKRFDEIRQVCQSHEDKDNDDESIKMRILHTKIPPLAKVELSASQQDWLRRQRRHYDNKLDGDQIEALNELDDTWKMNSRQRTFEIRFRELQVYKMTTGDCDVPISYSNRKLANWVSNLRKTNNSKPNKIDPSRRKRLDSLGFSWTRWDDFEDSWGIMSTTSTTTTTRTVESSSSTY
mmetsp:Transcript_10126/g.24369  ORF Transcript_10126/g.24369 Transcript_10126/m.24369 type:complete len:385 (+) Transcript_10126:192-1346(+)|eukprot:CAMPEP_0113471914 /NCGR_PEP_ID=MMETSP0014_2-20120614/17230_1 /TAXON_ID=2857 /ORGANISM="Nitzschia sp." /LENGTH=384 /DNA_ID=CAMNT_0000364577 /DNA_START=149 /DNA_END=1303 /DNA_ORIENTATION=+ /assembly_acc=CAM_ASM_000159